MPDQDDDLPFGLYERLITASLKARLLQFDQDRTRIQTDALDPAEAHITLARHIEGIVARALRGLPAEDRAANQVAVANEIIGLLGVGPAEAGRYIDTKAGHHIGTGAGGHIDPVEIPPEQLRSIQAITGHPGDDRELVAPLVPLSASDLLVNARGEPSLAHALAHEIPSADSIDLVCAFVRWHGIRVLEDQLRAHCRAGRPLRVITTVVTHRARMMQDLAVRKTQEVVEFRNPVRHVHGLTTARLQFRELQISRDNAVEGVQFIGRQVVLGNAHILLTNHAAGPDMGQAH